MKKLWLMCMLISSAINAQTFDFSCTTPSYTSISPELVPMIQDFIEDLDDPSVTIDDVYGLLATRDEIRALIRPNLLDNVTAYAYTFCGGGNYRNINGNRVNEYNFIYVREHWDVRDDAWRKKIVYHELGHSVFKYSHSSTAWDIMGYNSLTALASQWANALVRLLTGTDQEIICESSRSDIIIIDN